MGQASIRKKNGTLTNYFKTTKVIAEKPSLPHYTAESVVALLNSNDPRTRMNDFGTFKTIVLSDEVGYFKYSDKNGGTATFYADPSGTPIFTASIEVTDKMREAKCSSPDCTCKSDWTQLTHECGCSEHHDGERFGVSPRIELCSPEECDGQHGHLYGFCGVCFDTDMEEGKKPADATANAIHLQLR
jgi:hypothetical protein